MSPVSFDAPISQREIGIAPMPLYHIYGFSVHLISGFLNGNLFILVPNPRDIEGLLNTMKSQAFTSFAGVNTLFTALMQHPNFDSVDFGYLRWTIAGGAGTVTEIAEEWKRRTGCNIHEGYGLSETAAMASVNSLSSRQLGTIGRPMVGVEFKVVDEDNRELAANEEGELLIRGPQVMQGYWQRPEATAAVIDGYVRIVDRLKDMVLVSGFNVYPNEIENVVSSHPDVVECAVVGVPDDTTGEAVKLFVATSNAELDGEELREYCRAELTAYKVHKHVEFRDEMPKSNVVKFYAVNCVTKHPPDPRPRLTPSY